MKEAILYQKLKNQTAQCRLCRHFCRINEGRVGVCRVRQNIGGVLYSLNYGKIITQGIDPVEKKPLYHFMSNTFTYSIASAGCNFRCQHCQNADISQFDEKLKNINEKIPETTPEEIIALAEINDCPSISYTYTEPTIFTEFALDCMKLARQKKLKNIWVSNGYMSEECLEKIFPYLDAINIDLKFFNEKNYRKICGAKLQPVLDNLIKIKSAGVHLEVTTLIIPGLSDSEWELKNIAEFIWQKLGADTPWHVNAFYPAYQMKNTPPTPPKTILRAQVIGKQTGLKYVYAGNI